MLDYTLVDEPKPSGLARYTVRPFWILVSLMMCGAWLAFPWFIFNAHAMGSPTKAREMGVSVAYFGLASAVAIAIALAMLGGLSPVYARYLVLIVVGIKVAFAYLVVTPQSRAFAQYAETDGDVQNPMAVLLIGYLLREIVVPAPSDAVRFVLFVVLQ